jgi:hypothetical protein
MGTPAVTGAVAQCTFGVAPTALTFLPTPRVVVGGPPVGTIFDNIPMVNIPPFGMCTSLSNPTVAAATAAALGVLTPMPCIPVIPAPWTSTAPKTLVGGKPVLAAGATCQCTMGGMITMTTTGTVTTTVS